MRSFVRRPIWVAIVLVLALPAKAQIEEAVVDERLSFLEERLDASKRHGQFWQYGWMTVTTGGMVAGIVQATSQNGDDRKARIVEASTGAIGTGYLLLRPMEARKGADPIRAMPAGTLAEKQNKLLAAEALLERNAQRTSERTDWKMHLGNVAFNFAAGGVLLALGGNLDDVAINALGGSAVGALQLWTEPRRPAQDWQDYQAIRSGAVLPNQNDWRVSLAPRGIAFHFRF